MPLPLPPRYHGRCRPGLRPRPGLWTSVFSSMSTSRGSSGGGNIWHGRSGPRRPPRARHCTVVQGHHHHAATSDILKEFNCGPDPLLIFTVPPQPRRAHTSRVWAVSTRKYFFHCRGQVLLCIPSASRDMKYSLAGARYEASRRCRRSRTVHIEPEWPHRERFGQPWRRGGRRKGVYTPPTEKRTEKFVFVQGIFKALVVTVVHMGNGSRRRRRIPQPF